MNNDRPEVVSGRRCLLSASTIRLRRLHGFAELIGELSGAAKRIAGHVELRDACRKVVSTHGSPPGDIRIVSVMEKRKTVGHRVADEASALQIALAVVRGRTMEVRLEGPLVPKIARKCGLRDARRRPWAKDPEVDKYLESVADKFLTAWTPMLLEGRAGDEWFCALVAPRILKDSVGAEVVLVKNADGSGAQVLQLSRRQYPMDGTRTEEGVRKVIAKALSEPRSFRGKGVRIWQVSSTDQLFDAGWEADIQWSNPVMGPVGHNFRKRLEVCWTRVRDTALARFRRMLPHEVQEHASLCLYQFADVRAAGEFLCTRRTWTLQDYMRANQAIKLVPLLRNWMGCEDVFNAIAAGRSLQDVVSAAVAAEAGGSTASSPPHWKTIKALRGTWHRSFRSHFRVGSFTSLVRALDAVYRRYPHHPVFGSGELVQVAAIANMDDAVNVNLTVDAIMAHRDAKGKIRPCKDLRDTYAWISRQCDLILIKGVADAPVVRLSIQEDRVATTAAVFRLLFSPGRTLAGLSALVKEWHEDQRRLDAAFDRLFETMMAAKLDAETSAAGAIMFPHFLDGSRVIDGVTMRPLTSSAEIVAEGEEMDHCVGSYVGRASGGRSLLISQKSEAGRSTAEVALESGHDGEVVMAVRQNRAERNEEPPASHHRALLKLLALFPPDVRRQLIERVKVASEIADLQASRAYSGLEPEEFLRLQRQAFEHMRRFMPRRMARMSMEEWRADMARVEDMEAACGRESVIALDAAE